MRVLVTGAGGMLAGAVVEATRAAGHEPVALGVGELDITDGAWVERTVAELAPGAIVNCAAWTDVDGAEADEAGATRVNADGAGNLARAACANGALVVYPSTDYVFDGDKDGAYVESDRVGPISAYGRSKLAGEEQTAAAGGEHVIARTSWLFGPGGPNFVETMLRLAGERERLRVVADQTGCPTYTGHLALALVGLLETGPRGTVHLAGSGSCSWHEFATEIFRQAGAETRLEPCTTDEFPRPAPRPANSRLLSERDGAPRLPAWEAGLHEYLDARMATR